MKVEDIQREAMEVERELQQEDGMDRDSARFYKTLLGVFMAVIIVFMIVPFYGVKYDPVPKPVPKLDLVPLEIAPRFYEWTDIYDYDISPAIRQTAIAITSQACSRGDICYARSLYYYVRDNINYLSDPPHEYIQSPEETLLGAGDCEDKAILLGFLMKSIGVHSRLVLIPGHAYLEIYMPDAPRRYRGEDGWIPLDATCSYCEFGTVPEKGPRLRELPI